MADKWVSYIDGQAYKYTNTSAATWGPTTKRHGVVKFDPTKYSNITAIYVEVVMKETGECTPN